MPCAPFPSGRKSFLLLALAAAIVVGAWWWQRPPTDPIYKGKRLSLLVDEERAAEEHFDGKSPSFFCDQLEAYGPAGVRWLAYRLENGSHFFKKERPLPFDSAPDWLRRRLPERWGGFRGEVYNYTERTQAAHLLQWLGPKSAPATPALVRNLESDDSNLSLQAAYALQVIGQESWPVVQNILDSGSLRARIILLDTISARLEGSDGRDASPAEVAPAVAALVKALRDPDYKVREAAADAVCMCMNARGPSATRNDTRYDATIIPLIEAISQQGENRPLAGVEALRYFEAKATPAIPLLIGLLDSDDPHTRCVAAGSLEQIDKAEMRSADRLRAMLHDSDSNCRDVAAYALKAFGLSSDEDSASGEHPVAR